ncbi:UNVERIFIED_CONTAM: IS30 family transposase [Paenibacillus sp. PvR008]
MSSHLSIIERSKLEILHQQGKSARAIAEELGRHHATISREIRRNAQLPSYETESSQHAYKERRKASVPQGKWTEEQAKELEEKLQATGSPEQIVERFRTEGKPILILLIGTIAKRNSKIHVLGNMVNSLLELRRIMHSFYTACII